MIPKFRVFDSKFKEMEEVYLIDWQWPEQDAWINDNPSDDLIFMQSTGLHDKNGIDIFEGDIVKPRIGNPFVVKHFIFGQGVFKTALITSDGHGFDGIYHGSLVEVIGNVEQNHELLEDA